MSKRKQPKEQDSSSSELDISSQNSSNENSEVSNNSDKDNYLNEKDIQAKIDNFTPEELLDKILETKRDLLMVYLINLKLFKSLSIEEQKFSPIRAVLSKIAILLEKITSVERKSSTTQVEDEKREAPKYIIENKGIRKKRKKEESNPRVKNRRKAMDMFKKGKVNPDKNISDTKTKTNKFN